MIYLLIGYKDNRIVLFLLSVNALKMGRERNAGYRDHEEF